MLSSKRMKATSKKTYMAMTAEWGFGEYNFFLLIAIAIALKSSYVRDP